jgi:GTPase SAR1 family protein
MEHISDITMFILGKKNVGKTTLLNKYIENNENSNFKIENDEKYIEKVIRFKDMIKNIKIELIENNDFTFYNSLTKKIICFILIYSITDKNSFIQCREWIKKIKENYNLKNNKILLLGNKNDDKENRKVLFDEGDIFAIKNNLLFFECSCFNDYFNIENSINLLLTQIIEFNFENLSYIPLNPKSPIIINIIGDKSTGKSFIINNIPNKIIVDIGENSYIIITKFIKTQFENNKNKNIFYSSNGILFIYSYNDKNSFINLETFIENNENFKNHISFMPVIILGNNINDEKKEITFEEGKKLSEERLWKFIEISNKNNILKPIIKILKLIILSKNVTLNRSEQKLINDNLIINIKIPKKNK